MGFHVNAAHKKISALEARMDRLMADHGYGDLDLLQRSETAEARVKELEETLDGTVDMLDQEKARAEAAEKKFNAHAYSTGCLELQRQKESAEKELAVWKGHHPGACAFQAEAERLKAKLAEAEKRSEVVRAPIFWEEVFLCLSVDDLYHVSSADILRAIRGLSDGIEILLKEVDARLTPEIAAFRDDQARRAAKEGGT